MQVTFAGAVLEWRGPAPYHFVRVPDDDAAVIQDVAPGVSYGWGMVPVAVTVGATTLTTALWPKDGSYYVPLKDRLRAAEGIDLDDVIEIALHIDV